jgi:SNF2 family DNA or RNA helicase
MYSLWDFGRAAGLREMPGWAKGVAMTKTPHKYQVDALHDGLRYTRFGDYSDPGCGKTVPAQALALLRASAGNKAVYATRPTLVTQVLSSFQETYPGHPLRVESYNGDVDSRQEATDRFEKTGWPDVLVTSDKVFLGPMSDRGRRVKGREGQDVDWRTLLARGYTMLVVDDVAGIKNAQSKIHKAIAGFAGKLTESNGLWIMNGTPVSNNPEDLYGFFHLLSPLTYGSFRGFERMHCVLDRKSPFRKVIAYENLDELHANLYRTGRRVTKAEVMRLMPLTITAIPVTLSKPHKNLYDKMVSEMLLEFDDDTLLDFTNASKMYQSCQRILFNPEEVTRTPVKDNAMFAALDDFLEAQSGKAMVGCWYTSTVATLMEHLKKYNPVALYGGNTPKEREAAKAAFIEDPECKVIITNYTSGGVGVDGLQTVCSTAIAVELTTVPGTWNQWVSRLHRGGQKESVSIHLLVPRGTIAVRLKENLLKKDAIANEVARDKRALLRELMGVV